MAERIVIIGGGGHAKVVIDAMLLKNEFEIVGIVDKYSSAGSSVCGIDVIGDDKALTAIFKDGVRHAFVGIGSVGNCDLRKRLYGELKRIGFQLPVIVHPDSTVAKDAILTEGVFIAARAVVNPGTIIGVNAIINTTSSVDHDCFIGAFAHIAPGAVLSGGVKIGDETHIGTGANIIQNVEVGQRCMIGAGVTVRHNLPDGAKEFGRPYEIHAIKAKKRIFIIAEAGVNHNGRVDTAKKLIDAAAKAGADAVKFQTFKTDKMVGKRAPKASYQKRQADKEESQFDMIKRLELGLEAHKELMVHCKKRGIQFLSSPFDEESVDMLGRLGLQIFKIPSGEITNIPYLRRIGRLGKKVILSTGMAYLSDVQYALDILMESGTLKEDVIVLHCNTEYPTAFEDASLLAMHTIRDLCKTKIGYSDHTLGIEAAVAAAALGASVIEKHFTLSRRMKGPDHKASLEPAEFKRMAKAIRNVEKALGSGVKRPSKPESKNIVAVRKSIVAARAIKKGETFAAENLTTKRPATGISPLRWDDLIGTVATRDFKEGQQITQ